jgi:hypothetical protein
VCPTDPSKPLLEPEALQTTHTAFEDPNTPQAQSLATGKGVKVAFFADGLDINNPGFIRPDGSHVFIDYTDFSGDGLNAPTGAAEAFGDASSIAAQGRTTYDISSFNNPAHPLPKGCNVTVRGISSGASLIGMKVFGDANSAYNSVILQGLDYALSNDHPDVISESFGGYPIPDSTEDLTRQFDEQAVAAGVTVVESSGDSGVRSSPSSASSDPSVISAGASTTFRNYAHVRAITQTLSNQSGTVTLGSSSPTFVDQFGVARPYEKVTFTVPSGTDRLDPFEAWVGPQARVDETLIDPTGKMAAVQRAQGDGNHGEVDVHDPAPGTWTAIVFQRDGTFSGPVHWQVLAQKFGAADSVNPSALTLAPGQSRNLQVGVTFGNAGDASHDLELDASNGKTTVVPIVIRSLVALGGRGGTFTGDLIGGNGRDGAGQPGQIDTYDFDVPASRS